MFTLTFNTVNESYNTLISAILEEGKSISPRGIETLEISPLAVTITNPLDNIIYNNARKLNYGFMLGELAWILQASDDMNHICWYNKNWSNFSDDGQTLNGAYGKRIFAYGDKKINQFEEAFKLLKEDPESRQASIVLFDPALDYAKTKDKPCTNLMRFSIRRNKLNMIVFMRSNDVMFGYPYDVFNFTSLQTIMAGYLGVRVGTYTHIVDSFHMYTNQIGWCKDIMNEPIKNLENSPLDRPTTREDIQTFLNVEQTTRKLHDKIDLEHIEEMLDDIESPYWRGNAAFLALYNYRKVKKDDKFLGQFHPYINNELIEILPKYKALK